ncbi:pyrimidine 5'-nucleotidase [Aestuariispira insulae]|uniref:Putative hydrolase of the HAD superfamily n=1 Tax=Aestuariispira insulae TaxID=1461337 RepID=A0A3D9H698_9PROT|nr:pyrimidine 5'-nucleotidase [Aestuariispira insulae]RED45028.1 putative hydrolase of the HAD superfamily [Aestuariispira insulae]
MDDDDMNAAQGLLASETWIFDLDNTLYPERCNLFAQIDKQMGAFITDFLGVDHTEAKTIQKRYFLEHGTTLNGLMHHHGMDPAKFLHFVHDIDYSPVLRDDRLNTALEALPGRKLIFTNGTVAHADAVLDRIGIAHHFDGTFDIVAADYQPKPNAEPYHKMVAAFDVDPAKAVFVEDMAKNLKVPAEMGMKTVWVKTKAEWSSFGSEGGHVQHITDDLTDWLHALVRGEYSL